MRGRQSSERNAPGSGTSGLHSSGADLDRKFWVALVLYAVLAALAWFTMGAGTIVVAGRAVEVRLVPLIVIGGFALKTILARKAEKIRRGQ